jgi:hypothetical protein
VTTTPVAFLRTLGGMFPPAGAPPISRPPIEYNWPPTLVISERPPKLVYLDLNHWVALAKALSGHRDGAPFREALAACVDAVDRRAAVFPLADAIYYEVSRIASLRQRRDLAEAMRRVSGYAVVTSRSVIADHEVEALLDRVVGPRPEPFVPVAYLDWGVARAFGKVGGFRIVDEETGQDMTERVRSIHPLGPEGFDAVLADAELQLNRQVIEGPTTPEDEADLRRRGYNPYAAHEVALRRLRQELDQVERLDAEPEWRRGRTRDLIAAREVIIELQAKIERALIARGTDGRMLFLAYEAARAAFDAMPSYDVAVTMKVEYHRDPSHVWRVNDIHDIDALGSTLPYCDIVLTDKAAASHARRTGLADRLGTTVLSRLDDLIALL